MRSRTYARPWTTADIRRLADRIEERLETGVILGPDVSWLIVQALRSYAARPQRDLIAFIIADTTARTEPDYAQLAAANTISRLIDGEPLAQLSARLADRYASLSVANTSDAAP